MSEYTSLTMKAMLDGLEKGDFSAAELADAHLAAAAKADKLNTIITDTSDQTRDMAAASDARRKAGNAGAMEGVPVGVKDMFCTKDVRTTAASKMLDGFVPPYESSVTQKLWDQGAVMLGKLNLDEFAMGSSNENSAYGTVINPWKAEGSDQDLVAGGSSGGSAAAVAAGLVPVATGTDTGGSIRQPAAYTGIVGVKPTYGRCSRWGIIAFASSLDQAGCFSRTVEDSAIMLSNMVGFDAKDSTSLDVAAEDFTADLGQDLKGLKVGIPAEYKTEGLSQSIIAQWEKAAKWLEEQGAEIVEVSLPHTQYALETYYIVAPAEASSNLSRYDGVRYTARVEGEGINGMYENTRGTLFGDEVKRRIMIGTYVLSAGYYDAYYLKAQKVRSLIKQDFVKAFEQVDVLLTPTAPTPAFAVGANVDDPLAMYANDVMTVPASLAGLPGINVPVGLSEEGLPLGMQILGKPLGEKGMFRFAAALERAAGFDAKPAVWW